MKTRRSIGRSAGALAAGALCALLWVGPLRAAPAPPRSPAGKADKDVIVVRGKHYRPRTFMFMGRPQLNLSWSVDDPRFKRSFLERTLDAVWGGPF